MGVPDLDAPRDDDGGGLERRGREIEGVEEPDRCWAVDVLEDERAMEKGLGLGAGCSTEDDGGGDGIFGNLLVEIYIMDACFEVKCEW